MADRLVSVDDNFNLPTPVAARQAARLKDASTAEGTALREVTAPKLDKTEAEKTYAKFADLATVSTPARVPRPQFNVLDNMTTGWTLGGTKGTANFTFNDPSPIGSTSIKVTTNGAASGFCTLYKRFSPALDFTGKSIILWAKIPNGANVADLQLYIGDTSGASYFTLPTAGSFSIDAGSPGVRYMTDGWVPVTIPWYPSGTTGTPSRNTVEMIRINVVDKGNGAAQDWQFGGIGLFPEPTAKFPNGVLSIAFDDSYDLSLVVPKMSQHGLAATLFPTWDTMGIPGHPSAADYRRWVDNLGWEVGAHAALTSDHVSIHSLSTQARLDNLARAKQANIANGFATQIHAWPNAASSSTAAADLRKFFTVSRGGGGMVETLPPGRPEFLRSIFSQAPNNTAASLTPHLAKVKAAKAWGIFTFHGVVASNPGTLDTLQSEFNSFIDAVVASGIEVRTIGDVISSL